MAWDKLKPAGTDLISDIDTLVIANNTALELALTNMRGSVNLVVTGATLTCTITTDQIWLQKASDLARNFYSVSESAVLQIGATAGKLDTNTAVAGDT